MRKAGEGALVGQVPGVQRHAPDITEASSRSSPAIVPRRSAWSRRRAANTTASRERLTASFIVDAPRTEVASARRSLSISTRRLLMDSVYLGIARIYISIW